MIPILSLYVKNLKNGCWNHVMLASKMKTSILQCSGVWECINLLKMIINVYKLYNKFVYQFWEYEYILRSADASVTHLLHEIMEALLLIDIFVYIQKRKINKIKIIIVKQKQKHRCKINTLFASIKIKNKITHFITQFRILKIFYIFYCYIMKFEVIEYFYSIDI